MDPLTHTLVGANLAALPRVRRVPLAGPALVIGANLPDVDVLSYAAGGDFALSFRRGWTHGWPALLVLPLLLWLGLRLWRRARAPRGAGAPSSVADAAARTPFASGRLLALCYLAVLSHPCLDWLNTYGMRWRMPLDGTWFYGDSVFIADPWLWLLLGGVWLLRKRPGAQRRAAVGLLAAAGWIGALLALHAITENRVRVELAGRPEGPAQELMVGPRPANPLSWDVVARGGGSYRIGRYRWPGGGLTLDRELADAHTDPRWPLIEKAAARQAPGFLSWVRFPWLELEPAAEGEVDVFVMDARYARRRTTGFGGTRVRVRLD